MGIGGGIITKKLLFVVLLIASLSLGGIATANAAEVNSTQIQTSNTNTLNKDTNTQSNKDNNLKSSTTTQKSVDKSVKKAEKKAEKEAKKVDKKTEKAEKKAAKAEKKTETKNQTTQNTDKSEAKQEDTKNSVSSTDVQSSITSSSVAKPETNSDANASNNTQTSTLQDTTVNNVNTSVENSSVTTQTQATNSTTTPTAQNTVEQPVTNVSTTNPVTTPITNNTPVTTETTTPVTTQNTATSQNVSSESSASSSTQPTANTVNNEELLPAAGETETPVTFTVSQVKYASSKVKAFVETNKRLPKYVTIGTVQVKMPDFLQLLTAALIQLNNGTNNPITLKTVNSATTPSETVKSGTLTKSSYLDLAKRINAFINNYGKVPNYATTGLGKMRYESLIYMFSKVLNFEKTNSRLPSYVSVKPWSAVGTSSTTGTTSGTVSTPVPAELLKYITATANAQSNDPRIKALAASITAGKTSQYAKGAAIFNWVRDNLAYSFYYNTRYGAVGALNVRKGNCVDTTHLIVALSRAAGLPTRYAHGNVRFPSGSTYGHVWAEVYANGKWYKADGTSSRNTFGYMSGTVVYFKGYHISLPF